MQTKGEYEFIPYKFGCYSYSANADMSAMVKKGLLKADEKSFIKNDTINYLKQLRPTDLKLLNNVKNTYGNMSANALMRHTYINFPFYATRSEVAPSILNATEMETVQNSRPKIDKTILFTIGYEGISLEKYLVRLLKNDVKVLVDVRNNPMSMKYGFNKTQLMKFCSNLGIEYVHIPEVGIQSDLRQELNVQSDYDNLFNLYRLNNLTKTGNAQNKILGLLKQHKRIALTCFEANICQCHRKHLAEAIQQLPTFTFEVNHI
ncbi:MAG: DUF488 domain-containing protein [Bacteroidota bacterium]|nr:DUF488 domain-containing protein [Bacteroidota bacterium]